MGHAEEVRPRAARDEPLSDRLTHTHTHTHVKHTHTNMWSGTDKLTLTPHTYKQE